MTSHNESIVSRHDNVSRDAAKEYLAAFEQGRQEGRIAERQDIIRAVFAHRFDMVNKELEPVIAAVIKLPALEFATFLLLLTTISQEEILKRFGEDTIH